MKTNIKYETDEEWGKTESDFDLILTKEERKKFKKIKQNTNKNCALCSFDDEILNFHLFYRQLSNNDLIYYINKKYGYKTTDKELEQHRKHIVIDIDIVKTIKKTNKNIKKISKLNSLEDVERIDNEIQITEKELSYYEPTSKEYIELTKLLIRLIDLKNEITKGRTVNLKVESVEDLIGALSSDDNEK